MALVAATVPRCKQDSTYNNSGRQSPRIVAQMTARFALGSPPGALDATASNCGKHSIDLPWPTGDFEPIGARPLATRVMAPGPGRGVVLPLQPQTPL